MADDFKRTYGKPDEPVITRLSTRSLQHFLKSLASACKDACSIDDLEQSLRKHCATFANPYPQSNDSQDIAKLKSEFLRYLKPKPSPPK